MLVASLLGVLARSLDLSRLVAVCSLRLCYGCSDFGSLFSCLCE